MAELVIQAFRRTAGRHHPFRIVRFGIVLDSSAPCAALLSDQILRRSP
jgi:FlaA1/EpsC-like NDP-sugar epimerase